MKRKLLTDLFIIAGAKFYNSFD